MAKKIQTPTRRGYPQRGGKYKQQQQPEGTSWRPEFTGTLLFILAGITLLFLFTPNRSDFATLWLQVLYFLMGLGQYVFPFAVAYLAVWFFKFYSSENVDEKFEKPIGTLLFMAILLVALHYTRPGSGFEDPGNGGIIGWVLGELLRSALGTAGAVVVLVGLLPIVAILISGLSLRDLFQLIRDSYYRFQDWRHFRQLPINQPAGASRLPEPRTRFINRVLPDRLGRAGATPDTDQDIGAEAPIVVIGSAKEVPPPAVSPNALPATTTASVDMPTYSGSRNWQLPPVQQIFDEGFEIEISEKEIRKRVNIIEDTLRSFGVEAKVREINPGPAVTQFSLEPGFMATKDAKGNPRKVRVSRIVNLANDLALALAASPIRIEAPIPGRPYVGIEVPNPNTNVVTLRNLMESDRFQQANGTLKIALGQSVSGQAFVADLATMPHLLIAGATGSGKSVCINAVIACLLSTHTPETLRLLMIDPKMVELVNYNGIPHLLAPVVTELEKAVGVLSWATREMDRRYKLFSKEHVRNVDAYNTKMAQEGREHLPYIILIIDELADMMMMAPDEVERTLARLAQMARATGIHLILATQRPSVDVVTGLIKANFPARIAFAVSSQIDSRVILDSPGAERLLGKGDMLYMAADSAKLQRLQGVFVSDHELNQLVRFWQNSVPAPERGPRGPVQMPTDLIQQSLWEEYQQPDQDDDDGEDELLEKAIAEVRAQGKASVSLLQRRLRIGYARAARLIDEMESQGIIGADEGGGRARPVLISQADDEADLLDEED
jgi:S-DNA-T family DNA segregation ATPase FtsK/SpoIIIE